MEIISKVLSAYVGLCLCPSLQRSGTQLQLCVHSGWKQKSESPWHCFNNFCFICILFTPPMWWVVWRSTNIFNKLVNFVAGNYSEISSVSLASFQLVFFFFWLKDWNLTLANLGSKEIFRSILDSSKETKGRLENQ